MAPFSMADFIPVNPMTELDTVAYRNSDEVVGRPSVVFELRDHHGDFFAIPQRKLIHIAGMVRHLAIKR